MSDKFCKTLSGELSDVASFKSKLTPLQYAISQPIPPGMIMEFGVATGGTIRQIADAFPKRLVVGFDSFQGLPENWRSGFGTGTFACNRPIVPDNVLLIEGLFSDTLLKFLDMTKPSISLVHIDCDIYSSTSYVLHAIAPYIRNECIIVFDELINYPGCENHELKAFEEFLNIWNYTYKPLYCVDGFYYPTVIEHSPVSQAVVVQIFK